MKSDKLQNAIGMVDEELVLRAEKKIKQKKTKHVIRWTVPIAAMLAIVFAFGIFLGQENPAVLTTYAIQAEYPDMPKCPEHYNEEGYKVWREAQKKQASYFGKAESITPFVSATVSEFLKDAKDENLVYSPLNVYFALAILAEASDGDTREQILTLLGAESIASLRETANALWNANYNDDGIVTSLLASSLWMKNGFAYNEKTLRTIAEQYYASSFSGEMGSEAYNEQLRAWLDEQTGGLLSDYVKDIELDAQTILAIATTIYFKAGFENPFRPENNIKDVFHTPSGDVTTDFMRQSNRTTYYWGERFSAASLGLEESGGMWFILPDEGVDVAILLEDEEALAFIASSKKHEHANQQTAIVHYSIPKFDVSSRIDLAKGMKELGVTDCFDPFASDFTPLTTERNDLFVSDVEHSARVAIDEEGVIAAAYTLIITEATGARPNPLEEIDFVVDRPFIFVVTGEDGSVLFVGVVNSI